MDKTHQYTNDLIHESSPYLLQHAHNPVNWQAWNEITLEKAEGEQKLMVISIGYAACHWCHVMEHESFEDSAVAEIMNKHFISIKVDREERPDIDQIYMDACNLITGSGGWPLNAIALPDGRPVFAGTYFPKDEWMKILTYFQNAYENEPEKIYEQAEKLTAGLKEIEFVPVTENKDFTTDMLESVWSNWESKIDFTKGGRKGAPKFPMPNNYLYLLKYFHQTGNSKALDAVNVTLNEMAKGGIYDHLGGGFARYSVDADWKVPHFEKMLYDNAQLVSVYSKAYQLSKNEDYRRVVQESLEFIERELTDKTGGFYSSLDADSEGEEGKFYVWSVNEIDELLGDQSELFKTYYSVKEDGNWENTNILHVKEELEKVAQQYGLSLKDAKGSIKRSKDILFKSRSKRIRPGLDDKILTSWNALMIVGYVDAFRAFREDKYLKAALKNADFISNAIMDNDYRLMRNYKDGKSSINGFLDDYSFTIEAFISLYQATFDEGWLDKAKALAEYTIEHFDDPETSLFFYTSDLDPELIVRKKEINDNVIPASNSSMAKSLYYLGTYFYDQSLIEKSTLMLSPISESIMEHGPFYSNWAILLSDLVEEPYEIAVVGDDFENVMKEFDNYYLPDVIFLGGKKEGSLELLQDKLMDGETTIYVCKNKACRMPVTEVEEALKLMD
ncbi:MAG: thioredoxin domain-containing protein [Chitinophagales bacterium]|nr:thioredoxin domain-containing protein [Chitinophagales bacterium]